MSWILRNKVHAAIAAIIFANIIWGATPPIFKWSLEEIPIGTLGFFRFFLATLIFLPFVLKKNLKIEKKYWLRVFLLGSAGLFLHILFFFMGLDLTTSINAPIIGASGPIFLLIAAAIFLGEKPDVKKIAGMMTALVGVLVIVLLPIFGESYEESIIGNLFLVLAMIGGVIQVIILKPLEKTIDPLVLLFYAVLITSLLFFPIFAYDVATVQPLQNMSAQGLFGIIFGAVFATAIAYSCYYFAAKYLLASELGLFTYIDPIITIVVAAPLLGETPTPSYIIGAILVFLGIYIAEARIHYHKFHLFRTRY